MENYHNETWNSTMHNFFLFLSKFQEETNLRKLIVTVNLLFVTVGQEKTNHLHYDFT